MSKVAAKTRGPEEARLQSREFHHNLVNSGMSIDDVEAVLKDGATAEHEKLFGARGA
jgi:hypothetical protein